MESSQPLQVNVREVIAAKNSGILRWIPRFLLRWFERFVHQDELNFVLRKFHNSSGTDFAIQALGEMGCNIEFINGHRIPATGPVILVANHPLAGLDALALFSEAGKIRKDIHIITNDVLASIPQFKSHFIPVNKLGKSAKDSMVQVDKAYALGEMMLVFPAGLCSRKKGGEIKDLEWQKSFLIKSIQYNYTIVPIHIDGSNSPRFYRLANLRKFLGIKFNFEMMTLADELFKQKGKTLKLTVGKPICADIFSKKDAWLQAQQIREFVYKLPVNSEASFTVG